MIKKWQLFIGLSVFWTTSFALIDPVTFNSNEHVDIGDKVILHLSPREPGQEKVILHLPNGLNLTYGELISLGDYYGTPGQPIAHEKNREDMNARFLTAFNQFAKDQTHREEATLIIKTVHDEQKTIDSGLKQGLSEEAIYQNIGDNFDRQYNCLTGGGCGQSTWWLSFGRSVKLGNSNYDHFGDNALTTYRIGHSLALQKAIEASKTGDLKQLELAYAMNAFASHFLSDRYAAGHMRTPRNELGRLINPKIIGSLLVRFMHEEDNLYGLHVHNKRGDHWLAAGDKSYFSPRALLHQTQQLLALQASADQIFMAYQQGKAPDNDIVEDYIPYPDEVGNQANRDIAPLFYWSEDLKQVLRRIDIDNRYDTHWTSDWYSWSTFYALSHRKALPTSEQALLAESEYADEALTMKLIQDPRVLAKFDVLKQRYKSGQSVERD